MSYNAGGQHEHTDGVPPADSLAALSLSPHAPAPSTPAEPSPNPWTSEHAPELNTPPFLPPVVRDLHTDRSVLDEFDPLAAEAAWAGEEAHPPPADTPPSASDAPPAPPPKTALSVRTPPPPLTVTGPPSANPEPNYFDRAPLHDDSDDESPLPAPPASASTGGGGPFQGIASLAQKLSSSMSRPRTPGTGLGAGEKGRPVSIDGAQAVASPRTLATFASQLRRAAAPRSASASGNAPRRPSLDARGGDGSDSDSDGRGRAASAGSSNAGVQSHGALPAVPPARAEERPFDFPAFLEQMKTRPAEPVAKYLRSFLGNFAKRSFGVQEQVKLVHDFLDFIAGKMRECEVWRNASDVEFDNALEGMEKLVMNRLYDYTFTPHIAAAVPPRPVTSDDLARDAVLAQRIALFRGWLLPRHLDLPEADPPSSSEDGGGAGGDESAGGFLLFAEQEILKVNHYKAPRDKLICVLNCCKVIFGLIRHLKKDEGADAFLPILIYVVVKAGPDHMLSNVEFINRFRNPEKLQSEAGYYLSSLMGAVSFIETMDYTSLSNITQEEFERNVDAAMADMPDGSGPITLPDLVATPPRTPGLPGPLGLPVPAPPPAGLGPGMHTGDEPAEPLALPVPAPPMGPPGPPTLGTLGAGLGEDARRLLKQTGDAVARPLSALGRLVSDVLDTGGPPGTDAHSQGPGGRMTYLPGPFAPFELGRERREQQHQQAAHLQQQHAHQQQQMQQQPALYQQYFTAPGTPGGVGAPPIQTPYKPRVRRAPSGSPGGRASPGPGPGASGAGTYSPAYYSPSPAAYAQGGMLPAPVPGVAGLVVPQAAPLAAPAFLGPPGADDGSRAGTPGLEDDIAAVQAEIDASHARAGEASRETLAQIFPTLDADVREMVLDANDGDLGRSIEALLEMSGG